MKGDDAPKNERKLMVRLIL